MSAFPSIILLLLCIMQFSPPALVVNAFPMAEEERLAGYKARNYTWPPQEWIPSTLSNLMDRRIKQIEAMEDPYDRYRAYIVLTTAAGINGRNFTKYGWALTRAPAHLVKALTEELHKKPWSKFEDESNLKPMGLRCLDKDPFVVDTAQINRMILEELQDLHEQWVSAKLTPTVAYGMRVYQNQSQLLMHLDNPSTHIVSSILHIGSSEDAQEWPLVLEDYTGNTVEVHLTPGDLLLYESSRILHGRPTVFHGSWYTSLFIHYAPVGYWNPGTNAMDEMQYAVPPDWSKQRVPLAQSNSNTTSTPIISPISMLGMGVEETACDGWCNGVNGKRLVVRGPALRHGILESAGGPTFLPRDDDDDALHDEL